MGYDLQKLFDAIKVWGEERFITTPNKDIERQFLKFSEEVGELASAMARNDKEGIKDALGDIFVVWTMLLCKYGLNEVDVVKDVYHEINARKGVSTNGVFIKESDLSKMEFSKLKELLQAEDLSPLHRSWLEKFINEMAKVDAVLAAKDLMEQEHSEDTQPIVVREQNLVRRTTTALPEILLEEYFIPYNQNKNYITQITRAGYSWGTFVETLASNDDFLKEQIYEDLAKEYRTTADYWRNINNQYQATR